MAIPTNKTALQEAIAVNYGRLHAEIVTVNRKYAHTPLMEGHAKNTTMSLHQLISYLVGWGQLVLKWNSGMDVGKAVDFPETGYGWNELGRLAAKFYADYANTDYADLLTQLTQTVEQLQDLVAAKSNHELYGKAWYKQWTLGRMIQLNTSSPYKNAHARIRKWKKQHGIGN